MIYLNVAEQPSSTLGATLRGSTVSVQIRRGIATVDKSVVFPGPGDATGVGSTVIRPPRSTAVSEVATSGSKSVLRSVKKKWIKGVKW
jgi:hypothetical protein